MKFISAHILVAQRGAEWLGNDNRKTVIKVKTIGQMLPFKSGTALPSPSPAHGCATYIVFFQVISKKRANASDLTINILSC